MKADKEYIKKLLATARGQINGIINMIDDDKYYFNMLEKQEMIRNSFVEDLASVTNTNMLNDIKVRIFNVRLLDQNNILYHGALSTLMRTLTR